MNSVTTPTTQFTLRDDGIVVGIAINPEVPRTAGNVAASLDELEQLLDGDVRPGLWDARPAIGFPPAAWNTLIRRLLSSISALAIIADERVREAIGAFPSAMDALLIPVRVFDDEAAAIAWLQQFVED